MQNTEFEIKKSFDKLKSTLNTQDRFFRLEMGQ